MFALLACAATARANPAGLEVTEAAGIEFVAFLTGVVEAIVAVRMLRPIGTGVYRLPALVIAVNMVTFPLCLWIVHGRDLSPPVGVLVVESVAIGSEFAVYLIAFPWLAFHGHLPEPPTWRRTLRVAVVANLVTFVGGLLVGGVAHWR